MMSVEQVKAYFKAFGMADKVREFEVSSATVELAAQALGCEGARIAKSLAFMVDGEPVLVVTAGDAKIDNRKFNEFFHTKAKMTTPEETVLRIGHAIGGVCPFALKEGVTVYLDVSLRRFGTVYPACGSGNSAIELTIEELETYSSFKAWVDVCKGWQGEEEA
jgi:prolyl-tRNA editing enzyme YbaK/EbsC (Cys-tRNA(Pro) deacylase)